MAFNLEVLKTKVTDLLHTAEADLGPWLTRLRDGFHTVAEQVHTEAVAQENAVDQTIGDVQTTEPPAEAEAGTKAAAKHGK